MRNLRRKTYEKLSLPNMTVYRIHRRSYPEKNFSCCRYGRPGNFMRDCKQIKKPHRRRPNTPRSQRSEFSSTASSSLEELEKKSSNSFAVLAGSILSDKTAITFGIDTVATDHFWNERCLFRDFKLVSNSKNFLSECSTPICGEENILLEVHQRWGKRILLAKNVLYCPKYLEI
ncbi:hypothetical protein AVEN_229055-1 [Araneus ventricosus]|uniref:CCHC-type domain-containing protein n=1 Tax=Araneus ventricosus TaxID=182803 RepID=A0A4Y2CXB3_ARAVE|nr:hypothetical protein AVEN_229055-1 [Araneus ventricosus]